MAHNLHHRSDDTPGEMQVVATTYRPWLDGVRAIAVSMVLIEHGFYLSALNFGGTGVGIFFALSGYLITKILLSEFRDTQDIILKNFYVRRLARLMPALILLVVVCNVGLFFLDMYPEIKASAVALVYLTNYATLWRDHHLPGYGHTWSLAVEEHFYIVWPVLLLWLLRRGSLLTALKVTLGICFAILLWRLVLSQVGAPPRLLYVGSVERIDSILYGAAAAIASALGWRPKWWFLPLCLLALVLHLAPVENTYLVVTPALLAVGVSLGIWALEELPGHRLRALLSQPLLVWVGVMSYGIYLWHGVLFHVAEKLAIDSVGARLAIVLLTVGMAALSYQLVELPIRDYVRRHPVANFRRVPST